MGRMWSTGVASLVLRAVRARRLQRSLPRTRRATGSRSFSGSRCASSSIPPNSEPIRFALGSRCTRQSTCRERSEMSASDQEHKGGGYPPLTGVTLVLAAAALSFANFIVVLDTTIANVAMPTISGDLGVSTTEGTWIITAYAAAEAITVPLTGWLARRFGEVRLFVMCVIGFVAGSVLCGLSHSLGLLVAFRILQGDRKSTSELQSLMRTSYAVFCLKKK